jgi:tight adherence protein C
MTRMDMGQSILSSGLLWSPLVFAGLVALAALLVWLAFAPVRAVREVQDRMDGYLERPDALAEADMARPFGARVLGPALRGLLSAVGRLAPRGYAQRAQQALVQAGQPGGLTALDFFGLRLLAGVVPAALYYFLLARLLPPSFGLRSPLLNALIVVVIGFFLPYLWLGSRVRRRKHDIQRALPDALDMLTIGVEAGLAFESAMLKVGDKWHNALTREFRRAVMEMRVGTPRDEALQRMVARAGVADLDTFVAILIQSGQLGVSIAQVLHIQAAQMRIKRQQRAEELARQAGIKMVIPLVFCIFPAILVVLLGPALPAMGAFFRSGFGLNP